MKKELIFKNPNTKIKVLPTYLQFYSNGLPMLLSYKHIAHIYINKSIKIYLNDLRASLKTLYIDRSKKKGKILQEKFEGLPKGNSKIYLVKDCPFTCFPSGFMRFLIYFVRVS